MASAAGANTSAPISVVLYTVAGNLHSSSLSGVERRRRSRALGAAARGASNESDGTAERALSSPTVSFSLVQSGDELKVTGATSPINVSVPFEPALINGSGGSGTSPCIGRPGNETDAAGAGCSSFVECRWWDSSPDVGAWSTEGCVTVAGVEGTFTCSCDHLTEFIVFQFPTTAEELLATILSAVKINTLTARAWACMTNPSIERDPVVWSIVLGLLFFYFLGIGNAVSRDRAEIRQVEALVAGRKAEAMKAARNRIQLLISQAAKDRAKAQQAARLRSAMKKQVALHTLASSSASDSEPANPASSVLKRFGKQPQPANPASSVLKRFGKQPQPANPASSVLKRFGKQPQPANPASSVLKRFGSASVTVGSEGSDRRSASLPPSPPSADDTSADDTGAGLQLVPPAGPCDEVEPFCAPTSSPEPVRTRLPRAADSTPAAAPPKAPPILSVPTAVLCAAAEAPWSSSSVVEVGSPAESDESSTDEQTGQMTERSPMLRGGSVKGPLSLRMGRSPTKPQPTRSQAANGAFGGSAACVAAPATSAAEARRPFAQPPRALASEDGAACAWKRAAGGHRATRVQQDVLGIFGTAPVAPAAIDAAVDGANSGATDWGFQEGHKVDAATRWRQVGARPHATSMSSPSAGPHTVPEAAPACSLPDTASVRSRGRTTAGEADRPAGGDGYPVAQGRRPRTQAAVALV